MLPAIPPLASKHRLRGATLDRRFTAALMSARPQFVTLESLDHPSPVFGRGVEREFKIRLSQVS